MSKFKVGDRVKYVSGNHGEGRSNPLWEGVHGEVKGTINKNNSPPIGWWNVDWDNGTYNHYEPKDLELIDDHDTPY